MLPIVRLSLPKKNLTGGFLELQEKENIEYKMYIQGYQKFCRHHWRPESMRQISNDSFKGSNTGVLLWGEQGCGKSQILSYLTAWAYDSKWCNVAITDQESFINGKYDIFRYKNGLYLQEDLAKRLCQDFLTTNEELLREMDVDMSEYGKYDISGVRDDEPEPCPRTWDEKRKAWSDDWKQFLFEHEINFY